MSSINQRAWHRVGHVEVENPSGKMISYAGLDFRFEIKKLGDIYTEFSVGILGLTAKTINDLTAWNPQMALSKMRDVRIFAGYEETGESLIAEGTIWNSLPTPPPEMWLNIKCMRYLDAKTAITDVPSMMDEPKKIFEKVCEVIGIEGKWDVTKDFGEKKSYFEFTGTKDQLAKNFATQFNLVVYEENGILHCIDNYGWNESPSGAKMIDLDHGLLSIPQVNIVGADITTRLDDTHGLMSWIDLKSQLVPSASGKYYVLSKKHTGHLRGDKWQTELHTIRAGMGK